MASLDQLKAKYPSVLQVIQDEQISVKNLHLEDDKLFIKGVAPSSMPRIKFGMKLRVEQGPTQRSE